ncbi:MAG: histidine kinase [Oscillospiraceae bacterium]|nr:histidine kinase [Oscillospiraceae bacterium]
MNHTIRPHSLHDRLLTAVLLCWVLPVLGVMALAGILIGRNYENTSRQDLEGRAVNALEQTALRLDTVFEDSKEVSYDGVVRNSYRLYQKDGDKAAFYRTVNDYLNQNFARNERVLAAFLSFWEEPDVRPYAASRADYGYSAQREYREGIEQDLLEKMSRIDTGILLLEYSGELYLARNLLDSHFRPYATVVLLCDRDVLFQALEPVWQVSEAVTLCIDDALLLSGHGDLRTINSDPVIPDGYSFTDTVSGHTLCLTAEIAPFDFWREAPEIRIAGLFVALLAIPLLFVVLLLFRRHITKPVETLVAASKHLQNGERGFTIEEKADSSEFETLFDHFNTMSAELKNQFERSYQEQQALQQARMKALQSQINPHFLNNTLEIINWEARLAENDRVSAMIEALSVMMDGALARDGRSRIPLREELRYVDAYLYIIRERLGERLIVIREIDDTMMNVMVPRLILQPLAENAVEHDLTPRHGGTLCLRVYRDDTNAVIEVEHDGVMSEEDRLSVETMLSSAASDTEISGQVGLRNVRQRLSLLYGEKGTLSLTQSGPDKILARVCFPLTD